MNKLELFDKEVKLFAPWLDTERDFIRFKAFFSEELYNMTEFSPSPLALGIMLEGSGENYISNLINFMTQSLIGEDSIKQFRQVNNYFSITDPLCFKGDFSFNKDLKVSFYHRCDVTLEKAILIMKQLNIKDESIDYFQTLAPFLSKYKNLYIAIRYSRTEKPLFKTFFANSTDELGDDFYRAIVAVMVKLKLSPDLIDLFRDFRNSLSSEKHIVYTSLVFTDRLEPFLKFDYDKVPIKYVLELYKQSGLPSSEISNYEKYLNVDKFSYFGFKCINDKKPAFKTYFARKYALREEQKKLFKLAEEVKHVFAKIAYHAG